MVNTLAVGAFGGGTDQGVATVYQNHRCMRRRKPEWFELTGAGWGHGVGLCQIGAAVMGEDRKSVV